MYREVAAPAPAISSQSHPINPTPLSLFVPQSKRGVVFMGFLAYMGGGGGDAVVFGLVHGEGF